MRAMLGAAGYDGNIVLLHPTDQPFYGAMCDVVAASLKRVGMNVSRNIPKSDIAGAS